MITKKTHNIAVHTFLRLTAVMSFCRPMLPCGIIFSFFSKLRRESPAQTVKLLCNLTCLPGIAVPYIQVHEIQICIYGLLFLSYCIRDRFCVCYSFIFPFSYNSRPFIRIKRSVIQLIIQLKHTFVAKSAAKIIRAVNGKRLVKPSPSFRTDAINQFLVKTLCFRICFLRIDMDSHLGIVLMRNRIQLFQLFQSSKTVCDMPVFGIRRVMSLASVPLHHNCLRKSVRCQIYFLNIIGCFQIRVCCLAAEVHRNTIVYEFFRIFRTHRIIHNITVCNGSVLPVYRPILILIPCQAHFCTRQLAYRSLIIIIAIIICIKRQIAIFMIPKRTCQRHAVYAIITY